MALGPQTHPAWPAGRNLCPALGETGAAWGPQRPWPASPGGSTCPTRGPEPTSAPPWGYSPRRGWAGGARLPACPSGVWISRLDHAPASLSRLCPAIAELSVGPVALAALLYVIRRAFLFYGCFTSLSNGTSAVFGEGLLSVGGGTGPGLGALPVRLVHPSEPLCYGRQATGVKLNGEGWRFAVKEKGSFSDAVQGLAGVLTKVLLVDVSSLVHEDESFSWRWRLNQPFHILWLKRLFELLTKPWSSSALLWRMPRRPRSCAAARVASGYWGAMSDNLLKAFPPGFSLSAASLKLLKSSSSSRPLEQGEPLCGSCHRFRDNPLCGWQNYWQCCQMLPRASSQHNPGWTHKALHCGFPAITTLLDAATSLRLTSATRKTDLFYS